MRKSLIAATTAASLTVAAAPGVAQAQSSSSSSVAQALMQRSSLPTLLNPLDMAATELDALGKMSSGVVEMSAQGSSQLFTVGVIWTLLVTAAGQAAELGMHALRTLS